MDPRTSHDEDSDRETSSSGPSVHDEKSSNIDDAADGKVDNATADQSDPFTDLKIVQSKSSAPAPSPSTDERGWSTGKGSSDDEHDFIIESRWSSFEEGSNTEMKSVNPNVSEKERESIDEWGFASKGAEEGNLDGEASYDDLEDGSEWLSEVEKVATGEGPDGSSSFLGDGGDDDISKILPSLDKPSENMSSVWPTDSFGETFPEESSFNAFFPAFESPKVARGKEQETGGVSGSDSKVLESASTKASHRPSSAARESSIAPSQEITSSSDPISSVVHTDSYAAGQNVSGAQSKGLASTSSPDRMPNVAYDNSKSTSKDRSDSGNTPLSLSLKDSSEMSSTKHSERKEPSSSSVARVAHDSGKSTTHEISHSAGNVLPSSMVTSSDDIDSTVQTAFRTKSEEQLSSAEAFASERLARAQPASTLDPSSPLSERSPNATERIEEQPTRGLSSDELDNADHVSGEGSNFRPQPGDPSTFEKHDLKENVGSIHFEPNKSANQLIDQSRDRTKNPKFKSEVFDSKSHAMKANIAEKKTLSRRRQETRGRSTMSSSGKISSHRSRASRDESNLHASEATKAQPRRQSHIPKSRPGHSSPRKEPQTKERGQKPVSNRNIMSRKGPSHQSKQGQKSSSHMGGSRNATGRSRKNTGGNPNSRNRNVMKKPTRLRNQAHGQNEGHHKPRARRYNGNPTGKSFTTSASAKDFALNSSQFSKSVSFFNDCDCGLKSKSKLIHATISNEGYKIFVTEAYHKLSSVRPRLKYIISLSEWLHVHMLLLYSRLFDCELHFHNIILPPEFQIAIPNKIRVFEPIAAVISSIGIVEEADIGVTYIPVARSYRGNDVYRPHDEDDVTEFLEWSEYDWNSSWYQVEKARLERRMMAAEKNLKIPESKAQFNDAKLEEWQQLAVEKWLGWDDNLWFSYNQACYVLGRTAHFVSIQRDGPKNGSYAWLLPRHTIDSGAFVRLPRPNVSPSTWMIAVMLNMCSLEPTATAAWYHETNSVDNVQHLIDSFLSAALKAT
jgi:hypothetical protein